MVTYYGGKPHLVQGRVPCASRKEIRNPKHEILNKSKQPQYKIQNKMYCNVLSFEN